MSTASKYNLKWRDFRTTVSSSFGELRSDTELCDVTLVSEEEELVAAHKVVLSTSSNFFKSLLGKLSGPTPVVYLGGIDTKNLNYVLDYIYTGEVQLLHEDVDDFLDHARKFKVQGWEEQQNNENKIDYVNSDPEHEKAPRGIDTDELLDESPEEMNDSNKNDHHSENPELKIRIIQTKNQKIVSREILVKTPPELGPSEDLQSMEPENDFGRTLRGDYYLNLV